MQTLVYVLEALLTPETVTADTDQQTMEMLFIFALVWAVGGGLIADASEDHRVLFNSWWRSEWKQVRFPDTGSVFDYKVDPVTRKWVPFEPAPYDIPLPAVFGSRCGAVAHARRDHRGH